MTEVWGDGNPRDEKSHVTKPGDSAEDLGEMLFGQINASVAEVKAPPTALALHWLGQQNLTVNQWKFSAAIVGETFARRRAAAQIARSVLVEAMGLKPGAGSNQTVDRTAGELLSKGLAHRIRGHQRRATVWWLDWVRVVVGDLDDDTYGASGTLEELEELSRQAEPGYGSAPHVQNENGEEEVTASYRSSDPVVMAATDEGYGSRPGELWQQPPEVMAMGGPCASPRSLPTGLPRVSPREAPVALFRGEAQKPDPLPSATTVTCRWCYGRGCDECPDKLDLKFGRVKTVSEARP
jgi:hypothetical protein